jgi:hypothetical protein
MSRRILLLMVAILSTTTYLSAQTRNSNEGLEGLKDIGLVIKYGQVDGMDAAKRSTTLRMLEDRAKGWLRAAQVPIELADEAKLAGRPRLVFTITLREPVDDAFPLMIDGRLYQRVQLLRDPTKGAELATWRIWSMGPEATTEWLYTLFEKQVTAFIDAYRRVNPAPTRAESRDAEIPVNVKPEANALQGLNGVRLRTSVRFIQSGSNSSNPEVAGLKQQAFYQKVETEAENKFKEVGITLLRNETEQPGWPRFDVFITLGEPGLQVPAIEVGTNLFQEVQLVRDPAKRAYVSTWETDDTVTFGKSNNGASVITEDAVLKMLHSQIDAFIKAYKAAN